MKNRSRIVKYAAFAAAVVVTALFQNAFVTAAGASRCAYCLISLTVAVAMFEPELPAAACGLLAGFLWDIASPLPDGTLALFFTVYACACSLLAHRLLRQTVIAAAVLTAGGCVLYAAVLLLFGVIPHSASALGGVAFQTILPCFALTALTIPPYYFGVRAIEKRCGLRSGNAI